MHFSTFLSILSASGALAVPITMVADYTPTNSNQDSNQDSQNGKPQITVELTNSAAELATQTQFTAGIKEKKPPVGSSGPFKTVNIKLNDSVQNKDLRCKVLGHNGKPLVAVRGENVDITFSDGGKGAWTFKHPSKVSEIICDPSFKKGQAPPGRNGHHGYGNQGPPNRPSTHPDPSSQPPMQPDSQRPSGQHSPPTSPPSTPDPSAESITVQLSDNAKELATQTRFNEGKHLEKPPVGSSGPFTSVNLMLDKTVKNKDLRCQILDTSNKPITVKRGENIDTTFSDGGKGAWNFVNAKGSEVSKIICDQSFEKKAAGQAGTMPLSPTESSPTESTPTESSPKGSSSPYASQQHSEQTSPQNY